jgi:diacylglycerol O-acyltransferase
VKQLSGLDAAFLYMETPTTYGHVNGLALYQRPSPDFRPYDVVRERFGAMVGHVEPLRRRVVEVPMQLDHPYWFDDPDFDLDYHVREIGLARPGTPEQLGEQVARIIGRPMDRAHPLWEVYVIDGLDDGHWALLTKFHHATVDGAAGVIMLKLFTDMTVDAVFPFEPIEWRGEPVPSDTELLQCTLRNLAANPVKATRLTLRMVRNFADAAGISSLSGAASRAREVIASAAGRSEESTALSEQLRKVSMPLTPAPPTPWNRAVGPHRRFAMRSVSLDDIKALKNATGGTVNDVVMAICAGALREYLLRHDALPDAPLRSMVPVSVRTGLEADPWTNLVSSIVAELPTDCDDPLERVQRCRDAMHAAKQQLDLVPADAIMRATDVTSPVIATAAVRLMARLSDRVNLPVNVVISNVPGPREPLYMAGAKLDGYIPVSTISNGIGLNITVHSYEDRLDFGLVADRDLVPDLWDLVDLHIAEIDVLFAAAGAARPSAIEATGPPPEKSAAKKRVAKKRVARKSAARKRSAKQSAAGKRASARTSAATKSSAKKSAAKKSAVKKSAAKKSSAKKSAATKSSAKKSAATKSAATKSSSRGSST